MSKATITIEGYVAQDPTRRDVNGKTVVSVDVAHTPRKKEGNDWVDAGPTTWFQASFWDAEGEAVLAVVNKGTKVVITGHPELNIYARQDGTPGGSVRIKFPTLGVIPTAQKQSQPAQQWATPGQVNDEVPF